MLMITLTRIVVPLGGQKVTFDDEGGVPDINPQKMMSSFMKRLTNTMQWMIVFEPGLQWRSHSRHNCKLDQQEVGRCSKA